MYPNWWVFVLIMNKLCAQLGEMRNKSVEIDDVNILLETSAELCGGSNLGSQLARSAAWETGNSVVLIDGFDEIAPDYVEVAKAAIAVFMRSPVKLLWVTTRPVTGDKVKEGLGVTAFDLDPLTAREQVKLMEDICVSKNSLKSQHVERVLESFESNRSFRFIIPITGSPLIVRLLAEITCEDDIELEVYEREGFNLFDLYNALLARTFRLFLREKQNKDLDLPSIKGEIMLLWKQCVHKHCLCALNTILSAEDFKKISISEDFTTILEDIRDGEERVGLLVEVVSGQPRFVHRTVAEFFAAKWMSENWRDHHEIVKRAFNDPRLGVVTYFLNECFVEKFPLHRQVFRMPELKPDKTCALEHLHSKDMAGRTLLHIAILSTIRIIVDFLLDLGAVLEEKDELCGITPIYYAAHVKAWNLVRVLVDRGAHVENNFATHRFMQEMKETGVPISWRAFEANWPVFPIGTVKPQEIQPVIYPSLTVGHLECALWFREVYGISNSDLERLRGFGFIKGLQKRDDSNDISLLNEELWKVVCIGNIFDVEFLLGQGADVTASDAEGNAPLHVAAQSGKTVLVAALARRGADLKAKNSHNQTAEEVALEKNHLDVVKLLRYLDSSAVKESAFVTGLRLLEAASEGKIEDVRKYLIVGASTDVGRYPSGSTALHEAARNGHFGVVTLLCSSGVHHDVKDATENTALNVAAEGGYTNIVRFLIEKGADVNNRLASGNTPLHLAAKEGHLEVVRALVECGVNVLEENDSYRSSSPLHLAAEQGHADVLRQLIETKMPLDTQDFTGRTALYLAASKGYCESIDVLMSAGALASLPEKLHGLTPLHVCVEEGHTKAALMMVNKKPELLNLLSSYDKNALHGSWPSPKNFVIREILQTLESAETETSDTRGDIMELMVGVVEGSVRVSSILKDDKNLRIPLHLFENALTVAAGCGNLEFVKELLEADISKDTTNAQIDKALYFAAAAGEVAVIKLLLEKGANFNGSDAEEESPLAVAIEQKYEDAALAILEGGVNLENLSPDPEALLLEAARNGLSVVVGKLIDMGVDCNTIKEQERVADTWGLYGDVCNEPCGISALSYAAEAGHENVVSVLLAKGANVHIRDRFGQTAIFGAFDQRHFEVAEMLIKAGAEARIRDVHGRSPLDDT